jgi:hypothetical protein
VEVARYKIPVRARVASEAERAEYWPRLVAIYPSYEIYQGRTDRALPVVVLEPQSDRADGTVSTSARPGDAIEDA